MKISILVLILGLCKLMTVRSECELPSTRQIYFPKCGILPDCYQPADTYGELEFYSCKRRENGLPDFQKKKLGKCPTDKPLCQDPE